MLNGFDIYGLLYIIYGFLFQEFKQEIEHEFYTYAFTFRYLIAIIYKSLIEIK